MTKPKVAYIFSGHARTWMWCVENFFKNVYNVCPGDIYIHTWNRNSNRNTSWWNPNQPSTVDNTGYEAISAIAPDINQIYNLYKPRLLMYEKDPAWENNPPHQWAIEKYSTHPQWHHKDSISRFGAKNILYAFNQIFNAAKLTDTYDRFFCSRLDINFVSKLDIKEFDDPNLVLCTTRHSRKDFQQDIFFHGSLDLVQTRSDYYYYVDEYWYNNDYIGQEFEIALTKYLTDKKVPITLSNMRFNIPRIDGTLSLVQTEFMQGVKG